ncbi:MAG TPA: hypothetical protein VNZ52_01240 [Candidatus Thermoplasmatota archaeon]|nr:hypothetical protein [Candidatus Thermoplasmatota archaeon]
MRKFLLVLAVAAVVSGGYYAFMTPDEASVALASEGGSVGGGGRAPVTETAVLFGMLVALGLAGTKVLGRAADEQ